MVSLQGFSRTDNYYNTFKITKNNNNDNDDLYSAVSTGYPTALYNI